MASNNDVPNTLASRAREYMRTNGVKYQQALAMAGRLESRSAAPSTSVWLRALGISDIRTYDPTALWNVAPPQDQVQIPIGFNGPETGPQAFSGELFRVDLAAERSAVIYGDTGIGKSRSLRAIVGTTAALHGPDCAQFLLLDYVDQHTFRRCDNLPHVAGVFTFLSGRPRTMQALKESLEQEFTRRKELLARHDAADSRQYRRKRAIDNALPPLPELIVGVDDAVGYMQPGPAQRQNVLDLILTAPPELGVHLIVAPACEWDLDLERIQDLQRESSWGITFHGVGRGRAVHRGIDTDGSLHAFNVEEPVSKNKSSWEALIDRLSQFETTSDQEFKNILAGTKALSESSAHLD